MNDHPDIPDMPLDSPEQLEIRHHAHQAAGLLRIQVLQIAEQAGQVLTSSLRAANLLRDDQFAKLHLTVQVNAMLYDAEPNDPDAAPKADGVVTVNACARCGRTLRDGELPPTCADCDQGSE